MRDKIFQRGFETTGVLFRNREQTKHVKSLKSIHKVNGITDYTSYRLKSVVQRYEVQIAYLDNHGVTQSAVSENYIDWVENHGKNMISNQDSISAIR